jgi:hypothetical protein
MTLRIGCLQITHKPATARYLAKQTTASAIVFLVSLEVLGELLDALGKECNLDFWGAGIAFFTGVFGDNLSFSFFIDDGHDFSSFAASV